MRRIFLLLMLPFHLLYAQDKPYDTLEMRLAGEPITEKKLTILNELVDVAFRNDLNKALEYARKGVLLADKSADKIWQPKFYELQGRMHANLLELDSAMIYFNKAITGYIAIKNKNGQASTLFKIGWIHKKREAIEKAMKVDLQALKLMEELDDKMGIAGAYNRVSDDLSRQGRQDEAMEYAKKAIAFCEKNGLNEELVFAYNSAGNVCIATDQHQQSLNYFDSTIALARSLNLSILNLSDFLNSRGNSLKRLGRYKEALENYNEAMALAVKSNYANAINTVTANLGEVNLLSGNYNEALKYQLETVRLMEQNGDAANLTENYGHLSTIYEKLLNYPLALAYQKKARAMRDSTASIESDKTMSKMLTQYETRKKEATIALQEKQIAQQKLVQWLSVGVAVLLAGFLFFGYRSFQARTKANQLLAIKNAENELLLKEIHHRVKNNLEVVSSLLALQSAQIDDPNTKEAMLEGQNRVQSIGIVHQKLYQGTNLGAIEMKDYFINLGESILDSFGAEKRVTIECAMEQINVDIDTAVPLGLIVNELLTNTLKYAFPQGQNGTVLIKLERKTDGVLKLEVSDNGVGKPGATRGTGFGSQLVLLLTQQLGGTMREDVKDGTRIYFEFQMDKAA